MARRAKPFKLPADTSERDRLVARCFMNPSTGHGAVAGAILTPLAGEPGIDGGELMLALDKRMKAVRDGRLGSIGDTLAAQAFTLDALFLEMTRRAVLNLGTYPDAVERYMRLGLKAQAQSRATLEALAGLHRPREQTVRHVHVNEGGQAIVAEQFHHHAGGVPNVDPVEQSHAPRPGGPAGGNAALPGPDALRGGLPIPGNQGPEAVPNARRDQSGGP